MMELFIKGHFYVQEPMMGEIKVVDFLHQALKQGWRWNGNIYRWDNDTVLSMSLKETKTVI